MDKLKRVRAQGDSGYKTNQQKKVFQKEKKSQ